MLMNRHTAAPTQVIPDEIRADVETLWRYHDMHQELRPCDVGIGLGSHDLGVAVIATRLFHEGLFPWIVFTGANAPTTVERFPRGEAVHYREYAVEQGVPAESILVEPRATNTAENLEYSRALLAERQITVRSVMVMSRPYQQRRAYATCKLMWPEVDVVCASNPLELDDYVRSIGDPRRVVDMLVGDTQRIEVYAERGFAIPQEIPDEVRAAFERLVAAGYTSRLI
ncbi:YdcF family protein [Micromonospora sp. A200]|uniref:YdcF family protein n=1 Tax=Micromonospora sp. A200 TaxID=2940568 RepID=UPI00247463EB|nr:YdcF family protein [Micromonospora sp. A200]